MAMGRGSAGVNVARRAVFEVDDCLGRIDISMLGQSRATDDGPRCVHIRDLLLGVAQVLRVGNVKKPAGTVDIVDAGVDPDASRVFGVLHEEACGVVRVVGGRLDEVGLAKFARVGLVCRVLVRLVD